MPRTIGAAVGYVVGAVIAFAIGYAVVTRIPPLWALIQPRQS